MSEIKLSELRPAFVYLSQKGKTFKAIAEFFEVKPHTVNNAVKRFSETGSNKNRRGSGRPHQTIESLKAALQREWNALDLRMINRIVDNFPKRVNACIRVRGKHFE